MTGLHCDRCGSALSAPAAQTPQGRFLCPACAASVGAPRRGVGPAPILIALSVALFAGWTAYRFVALRADLSGLERRLEARSVGGSPSPGLSPAQAELLDRLASRPPASASDLEVLRRELSEVEGLLKRPGGLAALAPSPMPPSVPPPPEPPPVEPPPPAPLPPLEALKDRDPMVRYRALAALERPEEAREARPLLKDEMGFVRCAAAKVLGRLRDPGAVPDLLAMVRAEDCTKGDALARRAGLEALESITGVPCLSSGSSGEKEALRRLESWRPSGGAP